MSMAVAEGAVLVHDGRQFVVGNLMTGEELDALPVGAEVRDPERRIYTKVNEGRHGERPYAWKRADYERPSNLSADYNHLVSIPQGRTQYVMADGTVIEVGGNYLPVLIDQLPVRSVVTRGDGEWTRTEDEPRQCWRRSEGMGDVRTVCLKADAMFRVVSIGPAGPALAEPVGPETAAQFKARFAAAVTDLTEQYTEAHREVAQRVLGELGALGAPLPADPPVGTVMVHGAPDQKEFTVFRFGRRGWKKLVGHFDTVEAAGHLTTPDDVAATDDEAQIAAFKDAVWAAGERIKQDEQWCSAYDRLLASFGIVDPQPHPDFSNWPTLVKGEEAREQLPDGAVLGVDRGDWGVFVKSEGEWVRVMGTRPLAAGTMRLLGSGCEVPNANPLMDFMPVGSVVRNQGGHVFTKQDDRWHRDGGRMAHQSHAFARPVTWVGL